MKKLTYSLSTLAILYAASITMQANAFEVDHSQASPDTSITSSSFKRGLALSWIGEELVTTIGKINTSNVYVIDRAGLKNTSVSEQVAPNVSLEYKHGQIVKITIYPK